ncbi:hypothetical protein JIG36_38060 [Actinoplanes sp. LDG1-06]|uniref:Uncharacterized protein n=1 Tax=Paractinoplanes ovalisporus TaxID=2810368 RepID=A0ABS2APL7_9ACTN|nr:hypothetical protein [Actinoplanes ovalisporus]MBM2621323.1 hypothetical protein [Actinoplanes ovalisporus]
MSPKMHTNGALPTSPIDRRLDRRHADCSNNITCPAVFRLQDGNFAIIGTNRTDELQNHLPPGSGVADYERIVVIPKAVMLAAVRTLLWSLFAAAVALSLFTVLLSPMARGSHMPTTQWHHSRP